MEVEGIAGVTEVAASAGGLAAWSHYQPASPAHSALAEAKAVEAETPEQLAAGGDPLAIAHLESTADRLTPTTAAGLLPPHAAGAHEPGKGDLIDVYD